MNGTLTGTITPGQSEPGSNGNERVTSLFCTAPELLLYHRMQFNVISRIPHLGASITSLLGLQHILSPID